MCDFGALANYLLSAEGFMLAALVSLGIAIGLNSSFFGAPGAPIPFGVSVFLFGLAAAAIGNTVVLLDSPQCHSLQCAAQYSTAVSSLSALTGLLAAATVLGIVAAVASAVPWVGAAAMVAYGAAIVAASLTIPKAVADVKALEVCVDQATNASTNAAFYIAIVLSIVGLIFIGVIIATEKGNEPGPGPFPD